MWFWNYSSWPFSFFYYNGYLFLINVSSLDKFYKYLKHKYFCYMVLRYFTSSLCLLVSVYILLLISCIFLTTNTYLLSSLWLPNILSHFARLFPRMFSKCLSCGLDLCASFMTALIRVCLFVSESGSWCECRASWNASAS